MKDDRKTIRDYSPAEIRELVRRKYSEVALSPGSKYKFRVGRDYALDIGYPADSIAGLPETMTEAFTGVSSFLARLENLSPGATVLELGSGGGLDTALLAKKLGPSTTILGIDLSLAMIERASRALAELELTRVRYAQAAAEELPVRDNSVDCVVSNGIFNLSPQKERILAEIHRVLKPEGHVLSSEIVLDQEPSAEERLNEDDWFK
ncbi:MAG TPA: methyltransferase domain-containing protein [Candidatus Acidoferrales bacterium]|nr:methyltransferase domain-containing protein [Candidatus Acidoferrales bacterium]